MNNVIHWLEQSSVTANRDLHAQSLSYAAELCRLGVKSGDKVAVFFDNSSSYVAMLLAIWRINAVVVPLTPKSLRQSRYFKQMPLTGDRCRIKMLVYSTSTNEEVLIEWMRLCDKPAFPLDHFQRTAELTPTHAALKKLNINAEDIAVVKIPLSENVSLQDAELTHAMLLQQLNETLGDDQQESANASLLFQTKLLPLITLPLA